MKLKKVIRIRSVLLAKTGLRIGMSRDQMAIGDLDNPVVRNPLTDEPYIPGSSLKGKLRYLLEWSLGGDYILKAKERQVYASPTPRTPWPASSAWPRRTTRGLWQWPGSGAPRGSSCGTLTSRRTPRRP